ncbi:MAG: discoidin domain-containing protein [Singulisphaera sp.]
MRGKRVANFVVQTSSDGITWTNRFHGMSSGMMTSLESFAMPPTARRYVRIEGQGNSKNDWNSLTRVTIRGTILP